MEFDYRKFNQQMLDLVADQGKVAAAVDWLRQQLSDNMKQELRALIASDRQNWIAPYHFGWGMAMRNALRAAGFGEQDLIVENLDDYYVALIERAVAN